MLVLARTETESVIITTDQGRIEIEVLKISGQPDNGIVRLGITAPRTIDVHRREIQVCIDKEVEIEEARKHEF